MNRVSQGQEAIHVGSCIGMFGITGRSKAKTMVAVQWLSADGAGNTHVAVADVEGSAISIAIGTFGVSWDMLYGISYGSRKDQRAAINRRCTR